MNKIIIPSIFAATLIVATAFAFMPVEKASTVHTTISANIGEQDGFIGATTAGVATNIVVAAEAGKSIKGNAVLAATSAVGGDTCALQDTGGTVLIAAVAAQATGVAAIESGVTAGFAVGEGLQIVSAGAATNRCVLSINTDNISG